MKSKSRHSYILETLHKKKQIDIQEMADYFKVSPVTVRRDLVALEEVGQLLRTHGGAILSAPEAKSPVSLNNEKLINLDKKKYICQVASAMIHEGDNIFIDNSATVFHLCPYLARFRNISVITNSISVLGELIQFPHIRINLIGGLVDHERKSLVGYLAEAMLENYNANKAFIGCDGISLRKGLTIIDDKEASILMKSTAISENVYVLCESSKIEINSHVRFAPLSILTAVITDKDLDAEVVQEYDAHGIKIINA